MAFELKYKEEELKKVSHEWSKLSDTVKSEKRAFTADEKELAHKYVGEIDALKEEIETLKLLKSETVEVDEPRKVTTELRSDKRFANQKDYDLVLRNFFAETAGYKVKVDQGELRAAKERTGWNWESKGNSMELRAQTVGTPADGGYTVPESRLVSQLIDKRKAYGGMLTNCYSYTTDNGRTTDEFPTLDDRNNVASRLTENSSTSNTSLTFGAPVEIDTEWYRSAVMPVSEDLIQDSNFDIQSLIANKLALRLNKKLNADATNSADFVGILNALTLDENGSGNPGFGITYGTFWNAIGHIDDAYQAGNFKFSFNRNTHYRLLTQQSDVDDLPIWTNDVNRRMVDGAPESILGHGYFINHSLPDNVIVLGDWSQYYIRYVGSPQLVEAREYYQFTNNGRGFMIRQRVGGNCIDPLAFYAFKLAVS